MLVKKETIAAVGLGQLLSLCITGTSSASSALWKHHSVSIPFTQNFCSYVLLAVVYYVIPRLSNRSQPRKPLFAWQFVGFSFTDVVANALAVLAFKSTSLLSALVLTSWTTPCIMLLSSCFLGVRYTKMHIQSASVCLIGLALLIWGDVLKDGDAIENHSWIGDLICMTSATLYAVSNVTEEHLVKQYTTTEFLGKSGCWGSLLCGMLALYFEGKIVLEIEWSWQMVLLITIYVSCIFCMYSMIPTLYRMVGATFVGMSLITSNFYSLIAGLFFLDAKFPPFYPIAYILVIFSVTAYSLAPPPSSHIQKPDEEETRPILDPN